MTKYVVTMLAAMFMVGSAFANETTTSTQQAAKPAIVKKAKKAKAKKKAKKETAAPAADAAPKADEHKAE